MPSSVGCQKQPESVQSSQEEEIPHPSITSPIQLPPLQSSVHIHWPVISSQLQLDGFECIVDPNECVPSTCFCDGFYGSWYCTEDCGGGSCVALGDLNGDGQINVVDIVVAVNLILNDQYDAMGDMNGDGMLNVVDIIMIVNIALNS